MLLVMACGLIERGYHPVVQATAIGFGLHGKLRMQFRG